MQIIDCTIRDGGHNNNWSFSEEKVKASYIAANDANVEYFEIGYRQPLATTSLGTFAHCKDSLIKELIEPKNTKLLVMLDAGKADISSFGKQEDSPFIGIRIAAYPHELHIALNQAEVLLDKGYEIFINPMVSSHLEEGHFSLLRNWKCKDQIKALYLDDSFGSFLPGQTAKFLERFFDLGYSKLGFHAHNNLQLAVANTLEAIKCGASYVDATIYGMGRGAGNAPIEILTGILAPYKNNSYLHVIQKYYEGEVSWGLQPEYVLSGIVGIHPYYAEKILKYLTFEEASIFLISNTLPISYNEEAIMEAYRRYKRC